ncbi:hypothetical protein BCR33DRAFT_761569 [Rhizoclosmatium globosum]|uniref:Uncharacterized protein n=1 Tax=Rhizoclosmatium globosum TaxID=329046 RepID=A0A1Y2CZG9_9FUNG|nr:hypothetical protein BCR33DRAFT_761569 [Rhizoclosmatium globosum]|eukprot:ORY52347.1 hypothetical protein BCR33DRAFT_761569 [Rhizoclosmatium globosum]
MHIFVLGFPPPRRRISITDNLVPVRQEARTFDSAEADRIDAEPAETIAAPIAAPPPQQPQPQPQPPVPVAPVQPVKLSRRLRRLQRAEATDPAAQQASSSSASGPQRPPKETSARHPISLGPPKQQNPKLKAKNQPSTLPVSSRRTPKSVSERLKPAAIPPPSVLSDEAHNQIQPSNQPEQPPHCTSSPSANSDVPLQISIVEATATLDWSSGYSDQSTPSTTTSSLAPATLVHEHGAHLVPQPMASTSETPFVTPYGESVESHFLQPPPGLDILPIHTAQHILPPLFVPPFVPPPMYPQPQQEQYSWVPPPGAQTPYIPQQIPEQQAMYSLPQPQESLSNYPAGLYANWMNHAPFGFGNHPQVYNHQAFSHQPPNESVFQASQYYTPQLSQHHPHPFDPQFDSYYEPSYQYQHKLEASLPPMLMLPSSPMKHFPAHNTYNVATPIATSPYPIPSSQLDINHAARLNSDSSCTSTSSSFDPYSVSALDSPTLTLGSSLNVSKKSSFGSIGQNRSKESDSGVGEIRLVVGAFSDLY